MYSEARALMFLFLLMILPDIFLVPVCSLFCLSLQYEYLCLCMFLSLPPFSSLYQCADEYLSSLLSCCFLSATNKVSNPLTAQLHLCVCACQCVMMCVCQNVHVSYFDCGIMQRQWARDIGHTACERVKHNDGHTTLVTLLHHGGTSIWHTVTVMPTFVSIAY